MTQTTTNTLRGIHELEPPPDPTKAPIRQAVAWLGLLVLIATAGMGSNVFSVRDRLLGSALPEPLPPVAGRTAGTSAPPLAPTALRSAPWWQDVTTVDGDGTATSAPFTIDRAATQWRVTWSCTSGRLLVRVAERPEPLIDAACSEATVAYADQTGPTSMTVDADGPWRLEIAQQIDTPLVEPPLPGMAAVGTTTVATGSFYKMDETATGTVRILDQADGRYAVRLDDFFVTPNTHLLLRLSTAEAPKSSQDYLAGRSQLLTVMDVTAGSLNYSPPVGVDPTEFRSVVIWCPPTNSAYAAASLEPAR